MEPDVHKLQELVEWVEAEEAKDGPAWNQDVWLDIPGLSPEMRGGAAQIADDQICGSSYCIAGKAVIDAGYRTFQVSEFGGAYLVITEKGEEPFCDVTAELLGIDLNKLYRHPSTGTPRYGATLFEPDIDAVEIRVTAEAIAGKELR